MSKAAVAQIQSSTDKKDNLRTALRLMKEARSGGAELIAFPEFLMAFSPASQSAEELSQIAETTEGGKSGIRQRRVDRCAGKHRVGLP